MFKKAFQERRDLVVGMLNQTEELSCPTPEGAFYVYPDCSRAIGKTSAGGVKLNNDEDFAAALLDEEKVAVVPGNAFGVNGLGHVRACFATSYEQLIVACDRIDRFVQGVKK